MRDIPPLLRYTLLCCLVLAGCSRSQRVTAPNMDPAGPARDGVAAQMKGKVGNPIQGLTFTPGSDNPYFPLVPGTEYHYQSRTKDGLETETFVVTGDTKVIQGVTTRVIQDDVWLDGVLIEHTLDWFAQDEEGNVWYFGEDVTNIDPDTGEIDHEGSWEHGKLGAQAGIIMLAAPQVGDSYDEENAPGEAEDHAEVLALDAKVKVPAGRFTDCLQTENTTPLEPDVLENKFYAPGVGLVLEINLTDKDKNVLVSVTGPGAPEPGRKKDKGEDDGGPGRPGREDTE